MALTVRRHVVIEARPARVYRHLIERLSGESAGELRVGSRWRSAGATAGTRRGDDCEVIALEPDRAIGLRIESPTNLGRAVFHIRFLLDPEGDGSRLAFEGDLREDESTGPLHALGRLGPLQGLLLGLVEPLIVGAIERGLRGVRDALNREVVAEG
jgi:hypothetical protein